jgi:hypothetical protein
MASRLQNSDLDFGEASCPIKLRSPVLPGDATNKGYVVTTKFYIGTTPPDPLEQKLWLDSNSGKMKAYYEPNGVWIDAFVGS